MKIESMGEAITFAPLLHPIGNGSLYEHPYVEGMRHLLLCAGVNSLYADVVEYKGRAVIFSPHDRPLYANSFARATGSRKYDEPIILDEISDISVSVSTGKKRKTLPLLSTVVTVPGLGTQFTNGAYQNLEGMTAKYDVLQRKTIAARLAFIDFVQCGYNENASRKDLHAFAESLRSRIDAKLSRK